jgi:hypothetical protein
LALEWIRQSTFSINGVIGWPSLNLGTKNSVDVIKMVDRDATHDVVTERSFDVRLDDGSDETS